MYRGESLHELIAIGTPELRKQRRTEYVGAHVVVEVLGNYLTTRQQVWLSEKRRLEQFQSFEKETCEHAQAIRHNHRTLDQHRLQRRRARRQQHDIAGRHHALRVTVDERYAIPHSHGVERGCKDPARLLARQRRYKLHIRPPLQQPCDGRGEIRAQSRDFPLPAARQQRNDLAIAREAKRFARGPRIEVHGDLIGERMPDEFGAHRVRLIELLLERQEAQDQVDGASDRAHAPLTPRPDLRTDVLHRAHAPRLQFRRKSQVELLGVDADINRRPLLQDMLDELAPNAKQARQMRQNFNQPHHRQTLGPLPRFTTRSDHLRTGDAREPGVRKARAQRLDQLRAKVVARGFPGDEDDQRARGSGLGAG